MASELDILKIKIKQLEAEKESWLQEKVYTVQEIKKVEPPDYQENKIKIIQLEKKCKSLEKILHYGNISPVTNLIDEYQTMSKKYLREIAGELEYYIVSTDERQALIMFIDYIKYIEN